MLTVTEVGTPIGWGPLAYLFEVGQLRPTLRRGVDVGPDLSAACTAHVFSSARRICIDVCRLLLPAHRY